jgi:hypothetical protein
MSPQNTTIPVPFAGFASVQHKASIGLGVNRKRIDFSGDGLIVTAPVAVLTAIPIAHTLFFANTTVAVIAVFAITAAVTVSSLLGTVDDCVVSFLA